MVDAISIKMTTISKPYSGPCIMRFISHMMRTLNPSSRNPNRHESSLSCYRMFVVAATFIQSYAKDPQFCTWSSSASWLLVNMLFSGTRTSKNVGGGLDEKKKSKCRMSLSNAERPSWTRLPSLRRPLRFKFYIRKDLCTLLELPAVYCSLVDYLQLSLGSITPS